MGQFVLELFRFGLSGRQLDLLLLKAVFVERLNTIGTCFHSVGWVCVK
jgi:hypothetical protein